MEINLLPFQGFRFTASTIEYGRHNMKSILVILSIYLTSTNSYLDYTDLRRNLISYIKGYQSRKQFRNYDGIYLENNANSQYGPWVQEKEVLRARPANNDPNNYQKDDDVDDRNDVMKARQKALVLYKAKGKEAELNELNVLASGDLNNGKERYHMDPVFNVLRTATNLRRGMSDDSSDANSHSSSRELGDFKEQFKELWLQKKYEALNSTIPEGDQVNMAAARK